MPDGTAWGWKGPGCCMPLLGLMPEFVTVLFEFMALDGICRRCDEGDATRLGCWGSTTGEVARRVKRTLLPIPHGRATGILLQPVQRERRVRGARSAAGWAQRRGGVSSGGVVGMGFN
jgi:hypothetical protein